MSVIPVSAPTARSLGAWLWPAAGRAARADKLDQLEVHIYDHDFASRLVR